jgi:hypothetical protein
MSRSFKDSLHSRVATKNIPSLPSLLVLRHYINVSFFQKLAA